MALREIVTALVAAPPLRKVAVNLARSPRGRRLLTSLNPRRGVYESMEEAWKAAARKRHPGHEHSEAVELHSALAGRLIPSDYAVLYWLERIAGDIRVFDFGGNMGNIFYSYSPHLDCSTRRLEWTVYDLPKVIEMAKALAERRTTPIPRFSTSLEDSIDANVLLVSGAYHYWEKDTGSFLDQFPHLPAHVIVNRSPFFEKNPSIVSIQATMNFAIPIMVRNITEFLAAFADRGYELVDRWRAAEYGHSMPFYPEHSVQWYSGFYFRLKE